MDDAAWLALTVALSVVAGLGAWFAYQRRGVASGVKWAGIALLPLAALLTDTLQMFTRMGDAVLDWSTGLVFRPTVWVGVALAGVGVLMWFVGRALETRGRGMTPRGKDRDEGRAPKQVSAPRQKSQAGASGAGDEFDEIEQLLRQRGIE